MSTLDNECMPSIFAPWPPEDLEVEEEIDSSPVVILCVVLIDAAGSVNTLLYNAGGSKEIA